MGTKSTSGETYRLILAMDRRVIIAGERGYSRFEEAQARVADTVCHYGRLGHVTAVALQQGRPSRASNGVAAPPRELQAQDYIWTIEKCWDREVVQRILAQNQIEPPSLAPSRSRNGHAGRLREPSRQQPSSTRRMHKYTRWHATVTVAIIALTMAVLLFLQIGGNPARLLTTFSNPRDMVINELPFDARTSFTSETTPVQPDNAAPPSR